LLQIADIKMKIVKGKALSHPFAFCNFRLPMKFSDPFPNAKLILKGEFEGISAKNLPHRGWIPNE